MRSTLLKFAPVLGLSLAASVIAATPAQAASETIRPADLNTAETRTAGHVEFLSDGLHVYTDNNTSEAKAAGYFAASGSLPSAASLEWFGTSPQPGGQIVFDADNIPGNGNDFNILVFEPVYGDDVWLTNGSSATAKAADPSGAENGGNGSEWFGTLSEWQAALPSATVSAYGFSLGSGIQGDGVIDNITVDDTEYRFTSSAAPCSENYFPVEDMWEITWGRQYDDTGGLPTFTMESFGGLTSYNNGPVPAYMTDYEGDPGWQWLYPTRANVEDGRTVTYGFEDGTTITAVVSADSEGCPSVAWTTTDPEPEADSVVPVAYHSKSVSGRRAVVRFGTEDQEPNTTLERQVEWRLFVDGRRVLTNRDGFGADHVYTKTFPYRSGRHTIRLTLDGDVVRNFVVRTNRH